MAVASLWLCDPPAVHRFQSDSLENRAAGLRILALLLECSAPERVAGRDAFAGEGER